MSNQLYMQLTRADGTSVIGGIVPAYMCKLTGKLKEMPLKRTGEGLPGIEYNAPYTCITEACKRQWKDDEEGFQPVVNKKKMEYYKRQRRMLDQLMGN